MEIINKKSWRYLLHYQGHIYNVNFKANPATWFYIVLTKVNDVNWNKVTFKIEFI